MAMSGFSSPFALARMRDFLARDCRGSASLELAVGAIVLISVAALSFDLYTRIRADSAVARMAVTMADYVSRGDAPDGNQMRALAAFLNEHELGVPAAVVYVVTALRKPPGNPAEVIWIDDRLRFGDATVTRDLATACARHVDGSTPPAPKLPSGFTMQDGDMLVIVEVCARLTRQGALTGQVLAGDIYRLHALPFRTEGKVPATPAYVLGPGPARSPRSAIGGTVLA